MPLRAEGMRPKAEDIGEDMRSRARVRTFH